MMESSSGGTGEVHSHISSQPDKGEGMSGKFERPREGAGQRVRDVAERFGDGAGELRDRADRFASRVGGGARRVRDRAGDALDRAESAIDRTGLLATARQSPLPALGIAFAVGFMLAGSGDDEAHPSVGKAKNQIKGAIMGGISAAISQQLRTFIEEQGGIGGLLAGLGVGVPGEAEEYDDDEEDGLA